MAVAGWVMLPCSECDRKFGKMRALTLHKLEDHQIGVKRRTLTREYIAEISQCPNWQEFRMMMRGLPTERKLVYLREYLQFGHRWVVPVTINTGCGCSDKKTYDLVLYYLNDMSRTGLIKQLDALTTMNLKQYWSKIEVKR